MANKENEPDRSCFKQLSDEELAGLTSKFVPKNTDKTTKWALKNFSDWREARNASNCTEKCPDDLLENPNPISLNKWLSRYVAETRQQDGTLYLPKTIQSLLSGLLRHMRSTCSGEVPNFLQKNDVLFRDLHNAIDNVYRSLNSKGIGVITKAAQIFSQEDLNTLWDKQILGVHGPRPLMRAAFFVMGLHACLRGGEEHRNLTFSMLKREENCWIYTEPSSKNRPAGVSALNIGRKEVVIHPLPEEGDRCPVFILDSSSKFHIRPLLTIAVFT